MFTVSITVIVFCSAVSLLAGFIDAIAGGGGLLSIPAMLVCGVSPHMAIGTNKVAAICGTGVAIFNFAKHGLVNWRMALAGMPFAFIGSWLGSLMTMHLDANVLGKVVLALLPVAMVFCLLPTRNSKHVEARLTGARFWVLLPGVSLVIGWYDGFFGPAAGSMYILALHWVLRVNLVSASANAKALNLASNLSATVSYIWHGVVVWALGIPMAICFMGGNWLGSALTIKAGPGVVRKVLVASLSLLMASLIWRYFIAPMLE